LDDNHEVCSLFDAHIGPFYIFSADVGNLE